jgi:hypothetical protein
LKRAIARQVCLDTHNPSTAELIEAVASRSMTPDQAALRLLREKASYEDER